MRTRIFNNRRGQAAILYALMIPILFIVGGVGMDLGWYYLNVSRLQNAADAAVLAGGRTLLEEIKVKNNKDVYVTLKTKNYRAKLVYQYPSDKPDTTGTDITAGNETALSYAKKNLSSSSIGRLLFSVAEAEDETISYMLKDSYITGDLMVSMIPSLYIDGEDYYYVIGLNEDIPHFFMSGWFKDMNAPVVAVALLSKNISVVNGSKDPVTITFDPNGGKFSDGTTSRVDNSFKNPATLEDDEDPDKLTSGKDGNPAYTDSLGNAKGFAGWSYVNPNTFDLTSDEDYSEYFVEEGTPLTEELLATIQENGGVLYAVYIRNNKTLWEQMNYLIAKNVYDQSWDVSVAKYGSGAIYHNSFRNCSNEYLNTYHYYTEQINMNEYDEQQYWAKSALRKIGEQTHYFLDFLRNNTINKGSDTLGIPAYGFTYSSSYRPHSLVNVNTLYEVREGYNDDPLYCNFEGEPYVGDQTPIRQIVININVDNTDDKYRPLFFYYEGPDAREDKKDRVSIMTPEEAEPVILNLNANFKGVLWMPDIPVVINGNGYKFEGFIVAKEYRYLSTSGTRVKYSKKGETDKAYSNNNIKIDKSTGNVNSIALPVTNALTMWNNYGTSKFGLDSNSKFRMFKADTDVTYMYASYDNSTTPTLDERPFHEYWDTSNALIPLYNETGTLVTNWSNVRLYNSADKSTRIEIPKTITADNLSVINTLTGNSFTEISYYIRTVILDSEGNPAQIYDAAGNPIYFCTDYVDLTGSYTVFTLDRVEDGTRDPKEFLLPADTSNVSADTNISDTDSWK